MTKQRKTREESLPKSPNQTKRESIPLTMNKTQLKWAIFTSTVCLLVAWNYWAPLAFVNPFAIPPQPFAMYGTGFNDFHMYYLAGKMWLAHSNPYVVGGIIYPPTTLPFFGLFALLDFEQASALWAFTYLLAFLVALYAILRTLKREEKAVCAAIALLLLFLSYPFLVLFGLGQIDLLLSSLTITSLAAHRLNHYFISASVLAAATLMKGPPVLFLVYFVLFKRDFWYLVRFAAASAAIVGMSLLIVPVDLYWRYLGNTLAGSLTPIALPSNQSIPGVLAMMGLERIVPEVSLAGLVLFAVFSLISSRRQNSAAHSDLRDDSIFLLNTLVMLLFGTRSTVYPYVWVILPLAILLGNLLINGVETRYLIIVCSATFLLNAVLSTDFLNYQTLPLALLGNIILSVSLIKICLRPKTKFN